MLILNYMVTSNHIHLPVFDGGGRDVIPKSIQLVAGRSGQKYNERKRRKGAFWEDRYHATAVENGGHLEFVPPCSDTLFSLGKPRPLGGVRVNWLCLEITPNGVLEYWSIGVLVLKTKKR